MPVQLEVLAVDGGDSQRSHVRHNLRLHVEGSLKGGGALLHDLSVSGLLIETADTLAIGEVFQIDLPEANGQFAEVIWHTGQLYGCRFQQPISKAAVSASLLRSSPAGAVEAMLLDAHPSAFSSGQVDYRVANVAAQYLRKNRLLVLLGLSMISWSVIALVAL